MKNFLFVFLLLAAALVSCDVNTTPNLPNTAAGATVIAPPKEAGRVEPTKEVCRAEHYRFITVPVGENEPGDKVNFVRAVEQSLHDGFSVVGEARIQQIGFSDYYTQTMFRQE